MGKVIKISENKFKKIFESDEPYITMANDEDVDEYAEYHEFEKYINEWAEANNIDIEKDGWFFKFFIGQSEEGEVKVDFNVDVEPQQAYVYQLNMTCDNIKQNVEILKEYQKVLYALNEFNNRKKS